MQMNDNPNCLQLLVAVHEKCNYLQLNNILVIFRFLLI